MFTKTDFIIVKQLQHLYRTDIATAMDKYFRSTSGSTSLMGEYDQRASQLDGPKQNSGVRAKSTFRDQDLLLAPNDFKKWRSRFDILKQVVRKPNPRELGIVQTRFHMSNLRGKRYTVHDEPFVATAAGEQEVEGKDIQTQLLTPSQTADDRLESAGDEQFNSDQLPDIGIPATQQDEEGQQSPSSGVIAIAAGESCLGYIYPKIVEIDSSPSGSMFKSSQLHTHGPMDEEIAERARRRDSLPKVSTLQRLVKNVKNVQARKQVGKPGVTGTAKYEGILYPESYFQLALKAQQEELAASSIHSPSPRSRSRGGGSHSPTASRQISTRGGTGGFASINRESMNSQSQAVVIDEKAVPVAGARLTSAGQRSSAEASLGVWGGHQDGDATPPRAIRQTRVGGATFISSAAIAAGETNMFNNTHVASGASFKDTPLKKQEPKREKVVRHKKKKSVTVGGLQTQPLQLANLSVFIENLERTGNPKQASEAANRAINERKGRLAFKKERSKSQSRHINVHLQRPAVGSMLGTYATMSMNTAYPPSGGTQSNLRTSAQSHAHMTFGTGARATGHGVGLPLMFETQKGMGDSYTQATENTASLADTLLRVTPLTKSQEKLKIKTFVSMHQQQLKGAGNVMRKIQQYATSGGDLHVAADPRKTSGQQAGVYGGNATEGFGQDADQVYTVEDSQSRSSTRQQVMAGASSGQSIHNFQNAGTGPRSNNDSPLPNSSPSPATSFDANMKQNQWRFSSNAQNAHNYATGPYQNKTNPPSQQAIQRDHSGNDGNIASGQLSTLVSFSNTQQNMDIPANFIGVGSDGFVKVDFKGVANKPVKKGTHEGCANAGSAEGSLSNTERRLRADPAAKVEWQALGSRDQPFYGGGQQPLQISYESAALAAGSPVGQQRARNTGVNTRSGNASPARVGQPVETKATPPTFDKAREGMRQGHSYRHPHQLPKSNNKSAERVYRAPAGQKGHTPTDGETTSQYTMLKGVSGHKYSQLHQNHLPQNKGAKPGSSRLSSDEGSNHGISPRPVSNPLYGQMPKESTYGRGELIPVSIQQTRYYQLSTHQKVLVKKFSHSPSPAQAVAQRDVSPKPHQHRHLGPGLRKKDGVMTSTNTRMHFDDKFLGAGGFENTTVFGDGLSKGDGESVNPRSSKAKSKSKGTAHIGTLYGSKQIASSSEEIIGESEGSPPPRPVTYVEYGIQAFNKTMPKQRGEINRQSIPISHKPLVLERKQSPTARQNTLGDEQKEQLKSIGTVKSQTSIPQTAIVFPNMPIDEQKIKSGKPNYRLHKKQPTDKQNKPHTRKSSGTSNNYAENKPLPALLGNTSSMNHSSDLAYKSDSVVAIVPLLVNPLKISIQAEDTSAVVLIDSIQNTVSFRDTNLRKTQTYLLKNSKGKPERGVMKPQITNLVVEPNTRSNSRPMAQKKSSIVTQSNQFTEAQQTQSSFNLNELDLIIQKAPEPSLKTNMFLPNLRAKKNSMVQAQKAIKQIRQSTHKIGRINDHDFPTDVVYDSNASPHSPIIVGGAASQQTQAEQVDSQYIQTSGRVFAGDEIQIANSENLNIKSLLNIQQMAIMDSNMMPSDVNVSQIKMPAQSRSPPHPKRPSIDTKKIQKTKINAYRPNQFVEKAMLDQTYTSDGVETAKPEVNYEDRSPEFPRDMGIKDSRISLLHYNEQTEPVLQDGNDDAVRDEDFADGSKQRKSSEDMNPMHRKSFESHGHSDGGVTVSSEKKRQIVVHKQFDKSNELQLGSQTINAAHRPNKSKQSSIKSLKDDQMKSSQGDNVRLSSLASNQDYNSLYPSEAPRPIIMPRLNPYEMSRVSIPLPRVEEKTVSPPKSLISRPKKKTPNLNRTGQAFYQVNKNIDPLEAEKFLNSGDMNNTSDVSFIRSQQQINTSNRLVDLNYGNIEQPKTVKAGSNSPPPTESRNNKKDPTPEHSNERLEHHPIVMEITGDSVKLSTNQLRGSQVKRSSKSSNKASRIPMTLFNQAVPGRTSIELINQAHSSEEHHPSRENASNTSTQRAVTPLTIIPSQQTGLNKTQNSQIASTKFMNETNASGSDYRPNVKAIDININHENAKLRLSQQRNPNTGQWELRNAYADNVKTSTLANQGSPNKNSQPVQNTHLSSGVSSRRDEFQDDMVLVPRADELSKSIDKQSNVNK